MIDRSAIIHPSAKLACDVKIGPWTVIGENVEIGPACDIAHHVTIEKNTKLGAHNKIYPYASIGSDPQHTGYRGEETWLEIGNHNVIREFVTINRGTPEGFGTTRIGNHNYLMTCSHVAHDCVVEDHVIFANSAAIAGFVHVASHAVLGAFAGVHQHVKIGAYSFLGRATKIYNDILPYMMVVGNPGIPCGLNSIGLRRQGFSEAVRRNLKKAYFLIYRQNHKLEIIQTELNKMASECSEVNLILLAFNNSKRGIARHGRQDIASTS